MGDSKELLKIFIENGVSCSIAEFKGSSIAIDVSSWLHKALHSYIEDIVDIDFDDYMLYVDFLLYRTRNFRMAGVEPVMVFSGHGNSLKTGKDCQQVVDYHDAALEQGKRLLDCMRCTTDVSCRQKIRHEAIACFQRGLRVTPEVETNCIAALRRVGVMVIVAPYDADAQLASLCRSGICQAVLTEDPNLILYGAISDRPFPILYRFDSTGMVQLVSLSNFASSLAKRSKVLTSQLSHKKKKSNSNSCTSSASNSRNNSSSSSTTSGGVSSSSSSSVSSYSTTETRPLNSPTLPLKNNSTENTNSINDQEELLGFLGQLLHTIHGRRQFIQMCLLLGSDYIEPLFEGINLRMAQHLIIKFSKLKHDLRFSAIKSYADSKEGKAYLASLSAPSQNNTTLSASMCMSMSTAAPRSPKSYLCNSLSTSHSTYLNRIFRVEIMLYYHPIFDPKLKHIRNYSTPNYAPSSATTTTVTTRNSGGNINNNNNNNNNNFDSYPAVNFLDIFRLGHESHLLHGIPAEKTGVVTISNLCEGGYSMRDYQLIKPSLPWELMAIAQFSSQRVARANYPSSGGSGGGGSGGGGGGHKGVWHNRALLVRSLAAYIPSSSPTATSSHSHSQSQSQSQSSTRVHVTNLLSPRLSTAVVPRPPPSSAVYQKESERFQREYNRLVEAYQVAAARKCAATATATAPVHTVPSTTVPVLATTAKTTASASAGVVLDPCYKSPPTRKLDHDVKKAVTCSPSKGLNVNSSSNSNCNSQENIIQNLNLMSTSVTANTSTCAASAIIKVTLNGTNTSVGSGAGACGGQGGGGKLSPVVIPVRTPPASLSSSSGSGSMPLSPDLMRLATVSSGVHSPVLERKQSFQGSERSTSHCHSHSNGGSGTHCNPLLKKSSSFPSTTSVSVPSAAKRKHHQAISMGEASRGDSDGMSMSGTPGPGSGGNGSKKKRVVVTSITSYFKTSPHPSSAMI